MATATRYTDEHRGGDDQASSNDQSQGAPGHGAGLAEPVKGQQISDDVLRLAFDQSPVGIVVCGLDGGWLRANDRCRQMLGYGAEQLVGESSPEGMSTDSGFVDQEFVAAALAGERQIMEQDKRHVLNDGSEVWTQELTQLIHDDAGRPLYFVSFLQDISKRRHAQDLLRESERTLRAVIDNTPATISVKDRDHRYTLVNRGFEEKHHADSSQILGRADSEFLPADEIADVHARDLEVLETGESSQQEKTAVRNRRKQVLLISRFPLRDEAGEIHGVCTASTDVTERRFSEVMKRERLECSELIYSALAEQRLVLHAQPIVHLESMTSTTSELLIRMQKSLGADDLLPPSAFLPAAERFDLIGVIDGWVVQQAVDLAASGQNVSVNLSAKTISDSLQVSRIEAQVAAIGAAAKNLIFEVTETAVADDLDAARSFSQRMRLLGSRISLDDFGVGHGSFTYLRHLPVDYLKIDAQFVGQLLNDEEDRQVVQAIIGVAQQFNVKTVAEGVEDMATLVELRALGADYAQGYLTGRPMPLPESWSLKHKRYPGETHARPD